MVLKVKTTIILIMMAMVFYVLSTIIYTLIFVDTPVIAFPESTFQIRVMDITFGLMIVFLGFFMFGVALQYDEDKKRLNKRTIYYFLAAYMYFFLVIQGTLLYGQNPIGNSWLSNEFYIDAFGLYEVYVGHLSYHFFFESIGTSIFHSIVVGFLILIFWKGQYNHD